MYLNIIILPLIGSIVSGFFGRKVGVSGSQLVTCSSVKLTAALAIIAFFEIGFNNIPVFIGLFRWIDSEWFNIIWAFQFDSLTVSMLIPVLVISSLVHLYSIGYMSNDPHIQRFFSYLNLFTFMMIILVTANNYLLMFVGWEGVGVCSYLLISFWFTRIAANQSSMSAFLTNRVGDCFLMIGMFVIFWSLGNLDYTTVFSLASYINENIVTIVGICLLIGAMAKSSQVGLHIWLPMAMEGPTPVSALIHAATMVTAGVYLLMRSSPFIEYSSITLLLCLWLGAITTIFSSLIGLFQQDIKKVIAYSTMSQLGMMVIAIGLSSYNLALFHLVNHAFYKALLFLGAGSVIHAISDNQDFRKYGGLVLHLPLTYSVMFIASLSLVAFPFMTGFYSKDFILESAYGQYSYSSITVYFIAVIGAVFTTLYSVKVLYLTFLAKPNGSISYYKHAHEGDFFLSFPLFILAILSIFFGYVTKDIFIGLGSNFLFADFSIFIHPIHEIMINTEFAVPTSFKLLPFIFTISFSAIAIILSEFLSELIINFKLSRLGYNIFGFFNQRFLVEFFYNKYIVNFILQLGGQTARFLDNGVIESTGPTGLEKLFMMLNKNISKLNKSAITQYALLIFTFFILYLVLFITVGFDNKLLALIIILLFDLFVKIDFNTKFSTNTLQSSMIPFKRNFSTTQPRKVSEDSGNDASGSDNDSESENNGGNDNGNGSGSGNGNGSLTEKQKQSINREVTRYHKNYVPRFKEPEEDELTNSRSSNIRESDTKYGAFIDKHSDVAKAKAEELREDCINSTTEKIKEKFPEVNINTLHAQVTKEADNKFLDKTHWIYVLPGQGEWRSEKIDEGNRAAREVSVDSGLGDAPEDDPTADNFRDQIIYDTDSQRDTSPGPATDSSANNSPSPNNTPGPLDENSPNYSANNTPSSIYNASPRPIDKELENTSEQANPILNNADNKRKRSDSDPNSSEKDAKIQKVEDNNNSSGKGGSSDGSSGGSSSGPSIGPFGGSSGGPSGSSGGPSGDPGSSGGGDSTLKKNDTIGFITEKEEEEFEMPSFMEEEAEFILFLIIWIVQLIWNFVQTTWSFVQIIWSFAPEIWNFVQTIWSFIQ